MCTSMIFAFALQTLSSMYCKTLETLPDVAVFGSYVGHKRWV